MYKLVWNKAHHIQYHVCTAYNIFFMNSARTIWENSHGHNRTNPQQTRLTK